MCCWRHSVVVMRTISSRADPWQSKRSELPKHCKYKCGHWRWKDLSLSKVGLSKVGWCSVQSMSVGTYVMCGRKRFWVWRSGFVRGNSLPFQHTTIQMCSGSMPWELCVLTDFVKLVTSCCNVAPLCWWSVICSLNCGCQFRRSCSNVMFLLLVVHVLHKLSVKMWRWCVGLVRNGNGGMGRLLSGLVVSWSNWYGVNRTRASQMKPLVSADKAVMSAITSGCRAENLSQKSGS